MMYQIVKIMTAGLVAFCATVTLAEEPEENTWEQSKQYSSEAWDNTKQAAGSAWEATKAGMGSLWRAAAAQFGAGLVAFAIWVVWAIAG